MASSAETPDQSRGMSTNEFIAEMNNVRPVWAGRLHAETLILAS